MKSLLPDRKILVLGVVLAQLAVIYYLSLPSPEVYVLGEDHPEVPEGGIDPGPTGIETRDDIHIGYTELTPNKTVTWDKDNDVFEETIVNISEQGLRDRYYSEEPRNNTFRIAAVGDSTTFGYRVNLSQTWVYKLERDLNNSYEKEIEVLNFGVPAYNNKDKVTAINRTVLDYNPDLILFQILEGGQKNHSNIRRLKDKYLKDIEESSQDAKQRARRDAVKQNALEQQRLTQSQKYDLYSQQINSINELIDSQDIPVLVFSWNHINPEDQKMINDITSDLTGSTLFLPDKFLQEEYRIPGDGHPTPKAHSLVSKYLQDELAESGFLNVKS